MILTFRHRDARGTQKYCGDINIATAAGIPTSVFQVKGKGSITNNLEYLLLPINAVMAGQQPGQPEEIPAKVKVDLYGIIKKIFGE